MRTHLNHKPRHFLVPVTLTLTYSQSAGLVTNNDGAIVAHGWSGNGAGKNNPAMQDVHNVGPLPQGTYAVGYWHDHPRLGPMVAELVQIKGETFGRDDFFVHGAASNPDHYGQESQGCIVLPRPDRNAVKALNPDFIQVVG